MAGYLTIEQIALLKKASELLFHSGVDCITSQELGFVMRSSLGLDLTGAELQNMINAVDTDQDGVINFIGFIILMTQYMNVALTTTMVQFLTEEQITGFKEAFGHDCITTEALRTVMMSLGENPTEAYLQDIINEFDVDHDGAISFPEFLIFMARKMKVQLVTTMARHLTDEQIVELKETFKHFNKDDNDCITTKELGIIMRSLGQHPSVAELHHMINEVDGNQDGAANFSEFLILITRKMKLLVHRLEKDFASGVKGHGENTNKAATRGEKVDGENTNKAATRGEKVDDENTNKADAEGENIKLKRADGENINVKKAEGENTKVKKAEGGLSVMEWVKIGALVGVTITIITSTMYFTKKASSSLEDLKDTIKGVKDATGVVSEALRDATGVLSETLRNATGVVSVSVRDATGVLSETLRNATGVVSVSVRDLTRDWAVSGFPPLVGPFHWSLWSKK